MAGIEPEQQWRALADEIARCRKCRLCEGRRNTVVGRGCPSAGAMLVGEGPGEQEDIQGLPFVGRAGKLLDLALEGLMFNPDDFYIANIVKCRPPSNRAPLDDEAEACLPYLRRQFMLIRPAILVCMGAVAAKHIVGKERTITRLRGEWVERKGWLIMPTFHPAALLRDESKKALMWQDLKKAKQRLDAIRGGAAQGQ